MKLSDCLETDPAAQSPQDQSLGESGVEPRTLHKHGDSRAELIGRLFREHNGALIRFLRGRLRSTEEAADVAQEAYVRMLRLDSPGTLSSLRSYLFTTAGNIAIDRLRSRHAKSRSTTQRAVSEEELAASPEKQASDAEEVRLVKAYLDELPQAYREALLLYRFESLTTEEIGARMGVPGRTVRHYIAEALIYCRSRLEREAIPKQRVAD